MLTLTPFAMTIPRRCQIADIILGIARRFE
jgi:hypothetical protein